MAEYQEHGVVRLEVPDGPTFRLTAFTDDRGVLHVDFTRDDGEVDNEVVLYEHAEGGE